MVSIIPVLVISFSLVHASFTDMTRFKVYNFLTLPVLLSGLVYGAVLNGWEGIGFAAAGAFTGFGILLIPYLMGGLGAGDVKFVMAIGSWIGAWVMLPAILIGCVVVLAYHLLIVTRRQGVSGAYQNLQLMMFRLSCFGRNLVLNDQFESVQSASNSVDSQNRGRLIPFSAMMSIGIVIALAIGWLIQIDQ